VILPSIGGRVEVDVTAQTLDGIPIINSFSVNESLAYSLNVEGIIEEHGSSIINVRLLVGEDSQFSVLEREVDLVLMENTFSVNIKDLTPQKKYFLKVIASSEEGVSESQIIDEETTAFLYVRSGQFNIQKLDVNGDDIWLSEEHTELITELHVDSSGYYIGYGNGIIQKRRLDDSKRSRDWIWRFNSRNISDNSLVERINEIVSLDGYTYAVSNDGWAINLDSSGILEWNYFDDGINTGDEIGESMNGVAVSNTGSVYIASDDGYEIQQLNTEGNLINYISNYSRAALDVSMDYENNIYTSSYDNIIYKMDETLNTIWSFENIYGSGINKIEVDNDLNIYAGGISGELIKIDSNGNAIWIYGGHKKENIDVEIIDLTVDSKGNVYSTSSIGEMHKINSIGEQVWVKYINSVGAVTVTK